MSHNTLCLARLALLVGAITLGAAAPALAANPLFLCQSGQPFLWPAGGADIPFNPDQGGLGPLTHAEAVAAVQAAFEVWGAVASSTVSYVNVSLLPVDVDITNFAAYLEPVAPDGYSPIVFDATGEIFDLLFGPGMGVLGFASPEFVDPISCEIVEGQAFLNGGMLVDLDTATDVMVHEFGHYTNLAHSDVNWEMLVMGDESGPSPFNTFTPLPGFGDDVLETMTPIFVGPGLGWQTLHADDIAILSSMYPGADFLSSSGTIAGTIFAPDGTTRVSGVNVIARNIAYPFTDAVSAISGRFTPSTSQSDPLVGTFTINGLTPGAEYAVFVDEVLFEGLHQLPGPEEFYNGVDESSDLALDDPSVFTAVAVAAGAPALGIDIIFNERGPGGPLPVGDDGFVELALPFEYEICGRVFDAVFVNANGYLTFGAPDPYAFGSVPSFLSGPPRIAGLAYDLNPSAGGVVTYYPEVNDFRVVWDGVPEWPDIGSNSFEISLKRASNHIDVNYFEMSAYDGLAGVSCGGAVTSGFETASDLSSFAPSRVNLHNQPAVFEQFWFSDPNDLAYSRVSYNGTTDYDDTWAEPNNTFHQARRITLPFDSIPITRYTEIEPLGGDVDWYRFTASAGTTLVAVITRGGLDSMIGLFDAESNLIAFDDDGGSGLLSRIVFPIAETGDYTLAVGVYPDFDFDGVGGNIDPTFGQGRYVLDLSPIDIDSVVLGLEDDDSVEVPLGFTFPYQGVNWTSVFVNSNGSLTFGAPDPIPCQDVFWFLSGPPRIAALWTDLDPSTGGLVIFEAGADWATVSFIDVPEYFSTSTDTFSVTISADGRVSIEYGAVSAFGGLTGVTEGGGADDPGPSDLSSSPTWPVVGTTYELFDFINPSDLSGAMLDFVP